MAHPILSIPDLLQKLSAVIFDALKQPCREARRSSQIFYGQTSGLEAVAEMRASSSKGVQPTQQLFVVFRQVQIVPEEPGRTASDRLDAYRDLTGPIKRVILKIGLGGFSSDERLSQLFTEGLQTQNPSWKVSRIGQESKQWVNAFRRAEWWRFDPKACDPFETEARKAEGKGKDADAVIWRNQMQAWSKELKDRRQRRERVLPRTLWFDPAIQSDEDVCFWLGVILCQEQLINESDRESFQERLVGYLGTHFRNLSEDPGARFYVLDHLVKHFAEHEDARSLKQYIARVTRNYIQTAKNLDIMSDVIEELPSESGTKACSRRDDRSKHVTVAGAVLVLNSMGCAMTKVRLYDWIRKKKLSAEGQVGRLLLDSQSLERAKGLWEERNKRQALMEYLQTSPRNRSKLSAKKFIQRRLKAGKTIKDIALEISQVAS
jgi:hypothetical protein